MKRIIALLLLSILVLAGCSLRKEEETIKVLYPHNPIASPNYEEVLAYINEQTGYSIEFIEAPDVVTTEKLMLELSVDEPYAMIKTETANFEEVVINDQALDLKPYLEEYGQNILANVPDEAWEMVTDEETGAIYGIPVLEIDYEIDNMIYYRKDLLAKEGYNVPTSLEELQSVTCDAASSYSVPYFIPKDALLQEEQIMSAFGIPYYWNNDGTTYNHLAYDENFLAYANYMRDLYECGAFGIDFALLDDGMKIESFINGDTLFMNSNPSQQIKVADGLATLGIEYSDAVGILPPLNNQPLPAKNVDVPYITFIPVYMEEYAIEVITFINSMLEEEFLDGLYEKDENGSYIYGLPSYYLPVTNIEYAKVAYEEDINAMEERVASGTATATDLARTEQLKYIDNTTKSNLSYLPPKHYVYDTTRAMNLQLDDMLTQYIVGTKTYTNGEIQAIFSDYYDYETVANYINEWYNKNISQ